MESTKNYKNSEGVQQAIRRALKFLKPPEVLKPSEWAEKKCKIPTGNALPGPVRFRNAPYQVEPLDMPEHPDCYRVTLMWSAQTGKSQVQLMSMGYYIDHDPQSIMHMQPTETDLTTWLNAKFEPMVDSTPSLQSKIAKPRGREGVNNQKMKSYPGGFIMFSWSGSPSTMRGRSAPKIYPDETDGYERTIEGGQIGLIWQRAATFGDQRLLFETSTPTLKGASAIENAFELGDQRRWYCPCPHCGQTQYLKWSQVFWQKDEHGEHLPHTAVYVCEGCEEKWSDVDRYKAIRNGQWIAAKPFKGHASYHLPEMCSMFRKLGDIVQSFLDKKASGDLQTFVNVSLAETWEEEGESTDHQSLMDRRETYNTEIPMGACVLVLAADVQLDYIEYKIKAYGPGEESWDILTKVVRGDPTTPQLWKDFDQELGQTFTHESGALMKIGCTVIDSGAFTDHVYQFVKPREASRVYAVKGRGGSGLPLVNRGSRNNKHRVNLITVGVDTGKDLIHRRFNIDEPGPGYCHFSKEPCFDEEYFLQLCSEKRVTRFSKGKVSSGWIKKRPRNEAFDIENYCNAGLYIWRPNLDRIHKQLLESPQEKFEKAQRQQRSQNSNPSNSWINSGESWL